jgi:adenosine deaminase
MREPLTVESITALPKVLLHDHLDGGVRPDTLVELADAVGYQLPTTDPERLGRWFAEAASAGSLEEYLGTFDHTLAVMQNVDSLRRIAAEAVVDLAADGVVYAELRYAPELHRREGLSGQDVVDAVREGIEDGVAQVTVDGGWIRAGQLLTIMRDSDDGQGVAELALANRGAGVVGVDLAGPEAGFDAVRHKKALRRLRQASMPTTIHAGEASGTSSIAEALHVVGAVRIGHGARIVEDIAFGEPAEGDERGLEGVALGDLAHWVRDQQVTLEMCPSSNVQTGAATSIAEHPATALLRLGFAVTVNTDNRLMSGTPLSREFARLSEDADWAVEDMLDVTLTAAWSAFLHQDEREELVEGHILPGFRQVASGRHRA